MKLYKLIAGIYTGKIKTYNTRRSNKTGLKVFWKGYGKTRKVQ